MDTLPRASALGNTLSPAYTICKQAPVLQVRLDLGLTSPQAQWLAKGGSSLSSANLQHISEDPSDAGNGSSMLDSPYKHR